MERNNDAAHQLILFILFDPPGWLFYLQQDGGHPLVGTRGDFVAASLASQYSAQNVAPLAVGYCINGQPLNL